MVPPGNSADGSLQHIDESPDVLLAALEGSDVGVFVLGPDYSVRWINEATEEYFGLSREAVIGTDKRDLIESTVKSMFERPERFAETVTATYDDNTHVQAFECHVLPDDQRAERWLLHQSQPIETGELAGGRIEHYTDITGRKEQETELRQQNEQLSQFASVVSHDLRNPLNVAIARLELAQQQSDNEHLDPMENALARMERIIDDVLWLAREGQDIGVTEPVALDDVVGAAWAIVADDADGAEIRRPDAGLGTIEADDDRLCQLLENLFRNAIEHGDGAVTVTVGPLADGFYVEDDGPGIPEAERADIFTAGYSTADGGTGFGLDIVQQVAEAHGWTVSVTDGDDGGARFEITGVQRPTEA
ncbi:PAS domain-containing sensor histidine kinase [Halorientalis litorea]|uniref:PAS domain-containing sensor histidine kinase n=1 Tax=Halorientalis litorea TaxID=2931977 RepID=UPI001FF45B2A|nr:PAS domain-containing sensor histidine kinase [Halorientalis litorea]